MSNIKCADKIKKLESFLSRKTPAMSRVTFSNKRLILCRSQHEIHISDTYRNILWHMCRIAHFSLLASNLILTNSAISIAEQMAKFANWGTCTLCSEKNTHSHFLSYLHELFMDLNKNCSEYTQGLIDSNNVKIRYSLRSMT